MTARATGTPEGPAGRGRPEQREAFLTGAVEHVVRHGVGTLSLRPLAAALGTSDRMLLYYFGTREALLAAVLERVSAALRDALSAVLPAEPQSAGRLLETMWAVAAQPSAQALVRLYLEILGLAAAGREPFVTAAAEVSTGWLAFTQDQLDVEPGERDAVAGAVLAALDGLLLLGHAVDPDAAQRALTWVVRSWDTA